MTPEHYFLYCLWDKDNRSYYVDQYGGIASTPDFKPLVNKPIGWEDIINQFDTVEKYFSLVAAITIPLQFVLDGAEILRYLMYKQKGFQDELYIVIFEWNSETGNHELAYKGRIDFSKAADDPLIGVTVSSKEGGLEEFLYANEGVTYEIPLDSSNPDAVQVLYDGVELFDKYNYQSYDYSSEVGIPLPLTFINNEGDSVGVIARGGQQPEDTTGITIEDYVRTSGNYIFSSVNPVTVNIKGRLYFFNNHSGNAIVTIQLYTSLYVFPSPAIVLGELNTLAGHSEGFIDIDYNFNAAGGEKLFIWSNYIVNDNTIAIKKTSYLSLSFKTINDPSYAYHIPPYQLGKQLVSKMTEGRYTFESSFLQAHNNIMLTSGMALRNLPDAVLKKSFDSFFKDYNTQYCMCLNIRNGVLYMEKRDEFYNGTTEIFDLGEISDLKISCDGNNIFNSIKAGYPDQEYDERNGKFEFNSTTEFKAPVSVTNTVLDLISDARGGCYDQEFIRGKLNNKETTDNKGDNEAFMTNVGDQISITESMLFYHDPYSIQMPSVSIDALNPGDKFTITGTNLNNGTFTVLNVGPLSPAGVVVFTIEPIVDEITSGSILFNIYNLKRVVYDVDPPVNLRTNTVFNIEEMTPKRRLLNWGSYIRSVLFQLPAEEITFQASKKNAELVTELNGVRIAEKENIRVGGLAKPFFLNYTAQFKCLPPLTFYKTLTNLQAASLIKATYNGFELYFLPKGKMSIKSATRDPQEWELLFSSKTSLDTLYKLATGNTP